jgi:hypothetical protein
MTSRAKRIWPWIAGSGLMAIVMTLALLWWADHAPFKEGIIFDPIERSAFDTISESP